jgi:hypothetical protein
MSVTRREDRDPAREPIDHRAEAERLLRIAASKAVTTTDYAAVARGYAALACAPVVTPSPIWPQSGDVQRYADLRSAVRCMLVEVTTATGDRLARFPTDHVARLRALVGE